MIMERRKRVVKPSPGTCNLCGAPIEAEFFDAAIRTSRGTHWADVCPLCHMMHGNGLGTGRGQLYRLDRKTGEFVKREG